MTDGDTMSHFSISDDDARLIHALQLAPRASWSELSRVLAERPAGLARRYARLRSSGVIKVIGHPSGVSTSRSSAFIEIDVAPGLLTSLTATLLEVPMALTLDVTSSGTCLIASLVAPDSTALSAFLLDTLPNLEGVRDVRAHISTSKLKTGEAWTLMALDADEAAGLPRPHPPRARAARTIDPRFRSQLMAELGDDARRPVAALARNLDASEQRIHDAIARLLQTKQFVLRTDMANAWSEWPVHVWYFADIPPHRLRAVAAALTGQPEVRFVGTSAGPANLIFDVWLRSLGVMHVFEERVRLLAQTGIALRRQIILRTSKRLGHVIDDAGRFTDRYVPPAGL